MPQTPEDKARQAIDRLLTQAGWKIQDRRDANLPEPGGVAIREFPMRGYWFPKAPEMRGSAP